MENIYLIENHHEALGYWRNMHISNKTIIHIDSHHDLFEGPSFPWINNYLWFAIKENILKEIYLVYPKHIIKNFDFLYVINLHLRKEVRICGNHLLCALLIWRNMHYLRLPAMPWVVTESVAAKSIHVSGGWQVAPTATCHYFCIEFPRYAGDSEKL